MAKINKKCISIDQMLNLANNIQKVNIIKKQFLQSNKPIIVIGSQCVEHFEFVSYIADILKSMNTPIYLSGMARGLLGKDYNLQYKFKRSKSLKKADFILLMGVTCDFRLDYGRHLNKKAFIVSVNNSKKSLYLNQPLFFKANISLNIHPALFLVSKIIRNLKFSYDNPIKQEWINTLNK